MAESQDTLDDTEDSTADPSGNIGVAISGSSPMGGEDFLTDGGGKKPANMPLIIALVVALLGGGGYLAYKNGPKAAAAATGTPAAGTTAEAKKTINEFLSGGAKDLVAMEQMLRNTEKVVQQFLAYPSMTQVPLSELHTNPFRFAPPPEQQSSADEQKQARAKLRAKAIQSAQSLRIESIVIGKTGTGGSAIINGKSVKAGNEVDGFIVEEVRQGSVVIRDNNFRFELKLSR